MSLQIALTVAALMFCIGIYGALTRRNLLGMLVSLELMANAVNINLIAFSQFSASAELQTYTLFAMALTVAEVAIGLALVILVFRSKRDILASLISEYKG